MELNFISSTAPSLSRRDFLKLTGIGLFGLLTPHWRGSAELDPGQQGRILETNINVFDIPSFTGKIVKFYWKDSVVSITNVTIGDNDPPYNRVWYKIGEEGYAHSGTIQPVRTRLNLPTNEIPAGGVLGEVTVPYTDAYWEPNKGSEVAYRYYYETTHWVGGLESADNGDLWYRILEDKWEDVFYVPAAHIRLMTPDELTPLSPHIPLDEKRIEVRTEDQIVAAYEGEKVVFVTRTATGAKFSTGDFSTPSGHHIVYHKRPSRHMAAGNLALNGYDLPGVPWVCYFTEDGISFHGTFWHNDFGKPRSHGCINLTPQAAKWIYRWTLPYVRFNEQKAYEPYGTAVDVI